MSDTIDLLAAELALGLLTAGERMEAETLRAADSRFAMDVAKWEAVTEGWLEDLPDEPVSPALWGRITTLIAPSPCLPGATGSIGQATIITARPGLWRPLAIAASLLACVFAGLWMSGRHTLPQSPASGLPASSTSARFSMAQIGGAGAPHLATMLYDRRSGTLTIRIAAIAADPARAPEVWLINGTNAPRSLGFGSTGAATRMQANARLKSSLVDGATLAITLEPISPKPHAAPSSRILGTGTISSI